MDPAAVRVLIDRYGRVIRDVQKQRSPRWSGRTNREGFRLNSDAVRRRTGKQTLPTRINEKQITDRTVRRNADTIGLNNNLLDAVRTVCRKFSRQSVRRKREDRVFSPKFYRHSRSPDKQNVEYYYVHPVWIGR